MTARETHLIAAGAVLDLDEAKAAPLIRAGFFEPAGRDPPGSSSLAEVDFLAAHVGTNWRESGYPYSSQFGKCEWARP